MFLTAVILILFFSLSDLAKWMNQNGDTYALREFINLEKLCMLICFDTESKNKSIKYSTFPDSRFRLQKS